MSANYSREDTSVGKIFQELVKSIPILAYPNIKGKDRSIYSNKLQITDNKPG